MKVYTNFIQGSVDWEIARCSIPTASELDALISPTWKIRTGDAPRSYLHKKLCERWTGGPLATLQGIFDVEQGRILEEKAKPAFTLETGLEVQNVGFVTTDDGLFGCSPDGLVGDNSGLECKCPRMDTHIGYLLEGEVPPEYLAQVHGSMYATGRDSWYFMSYRSQFPSLILKVNRDEKIQGIIREALERFNEVFDDAWFELVRLNGQPPKKNGFREKILTPINPQPETNDLIP